MEKQTKNLGPKKATLTKEKTPTARDLYAAHAMGALITNSRGLLHMSEIKSAAFVWADFMIKD